MSRFHSTKKSFGYAIDGLKTAVRKEPNMQIHVAIAVIVLGLAAYIRVTFAEWALLMFTIFFVLILELFNTSLESIVNLVSPDIHPKAKVAKDVAAAAVLMAAIMSVLVGIIIFTPYLFLQK